MAYYNSIDCVYGNKTDLEHYVKCIYILQNTGGSEEIIDMLKEKVMDIFKDVPVKNGYKTMDSYRYYPNGLIEPARAQGVCQVLVDEWNTEEISKIREKRKTYIELKRFNEFWYYQLKEYLGLSYKIKFDQYDDFQGEINLQVIKEKLAKYNALDEEGKKFFNEEKLEEEYDYTMRQIELMVCQHSYFGVYLGEEQLKFIKEMYDTHTDKWINGGGLYRVLDKMQNSMEKSKTNVIQNVVRKYRSYSREDLETFIEELKKIEEPIVQKVLKRLGVE